MSSVGDIKTGSADEPPARAARGDEGWRRHPVKVLQAYYQRQRIAGKLNLVLLLLWSLVLVNSAFVFAGLYVAYDRAQSVLTLNEFEKQIDEIRLAQWRFRYSRERADALAVRDQLDRARETLARLPADVLDAPVLSGGGQSTDALMRDFERRSHEYLFFHEQALALERAMEKTSDDLLAGLNDLQTLAARESSVLAPVPASLAQAVLNARIVEKEYVSGQTPRSDARMAQVVDAIIAEAAQARRLAENVDTRIAAYKIGQQARLLGDAFAKMRDYAMRSVTNETGMNQAAITVAERVASASKRQRDAIDR